MIKRLVFVLSALLVLVLGVEVGLPKVLEKVVAQGMYSATGSREVAAKLEKSPAIFMLTGNFDRIILDAANARIDKLTVGAMHVSMNDVELDLESLLAGRKVVMKKAGEIKLTAAITQEEMANYLNTAVKGISGATVVIDPGKITVGAQMTVGGLIKTDAKLEGKLIADAQKIKFIPDRFFLNTASVKTSSLFTGKFLSEIPVLDSSKLPFGVVVRKIVMENGQVVIEADNVQY